MQCYTPCSEVDAVQVWQGPAAVAGTAMAAAAAAAAPTVLLVISRQCTANAQAIRRHFRADFDAGSSAYCHRLSQHVRIEKVVH